MTLNQRFDTGRRPSHGESILMRTENQFRRPSVRDMTELYQLQEKIAESESLSLEYQRKIEAIKPQLPQMGDLIVDRGSYSDF